MKDYKKVFDLVYSNLPEELVKETLELSFPVISEGIEEVEERDTLVESIVNYIDYMTKQNITEKSLDNIIEYTLENLDEALINEVNEAFMERKATEAINELFGFGKSEERKQAESNLKAAKAEVKKTSGSPIGMKSLERQGAARDAQLTAKSNLDAVKTKERKQAIDNLKSSAKKVWGKVKSGFGKAKETVKTGAEKAVVGTGKAVAKGLRSSAAGMHKLARKIEGRKPAETSKLNKAIQSTTGAGDISVKSSNLDFTKKETPKKEEKPVAKKKTVSKKEDNGQLKLDLETPKATKTRKKPSKDQVLTQKGKDTTKAIVAATKKAAAKANKATKTKKTTKKVVTANEALADFISILAKSNISESSFVEIMEMTMNKETAEKAVAKEKNIADKIADSIHKDVEEGKGPSEQKLDAANRATEKYNKMKNWVSKRYSENQ